MISESKRKLYQSIILFLHNELSVIDYSSDTIESLEVARQCLENAFEITTDECKTSINLLSLMEKSSESNKPKVEKRESTAEDRAMADNLKTQGNHCMIEEKFQEAIACYTKAIELDPNSAVYYCNRAAAYGRLNNNDEALKDCEQAVNIDPTYSKAYGRMGLAYSGKSNYIKAIECYKKAISLDPDNQNFQQNLTIAETRQAESLTANANPMGGLDLNSFFSNPAMQNLAQRFISDPQLQNTMSTMIQNIIGNPNAAAPPTTGDNTPHSNNSEPSLNIDNIPIDNLLNLGQQLAQQMQQTNPEMVSNLRQRMQNTGQNADNTAGNTHPSNGTNEDKN